MNDKISFEESLFGDEKEFILDEIDVGFCLDRIIEIPSLRPLKIERAVEICIRYCQNHEFRREILKKIYKCPILIYRLYKRSVFVYSEIEPLLRSRNSFIPSYYFRKEIEDFNSFITSKKKPFDLDNSFLENEEEIDKIIEYGFVPSSVEYCLKYDDFAVFRDVFTTYPNNVRWSPLEWSARPSSLEILAFSGYFGSIRCFKHLILNGFTINDNVRSLIAFSGSFDLFHLCFDEGFNTRECLFNASRFCRLSLIKFLTENGADLNVKSNSNMTPLHYSSQNGHLSVVDYLVKNGADINGGFNSVECVFMYILLSTLQPKIDILVLLNTWLIIKQTFSLGSIARVFLYGQLLEVILILLIV